MRSTASFSVDLRGEVYRTDMSLFVSKNIALFYKPQYVVHQDSGLIAEHDKHGASITNAA
eukprot:5463943-Amphidinium_carterae.1